MDGHHRRVAGLDLCAQPDCGARACGQCWCCGGLYCPTHLWCTQAGGRCDACVNDPGGGLTGQC
jgi:hypothetical protein